MGIEPLLEHVIEIDRSGLPAIHRREHLDVVRGIVFVMPGKAFGAEAQEGLHDFGGLRLLDKEKVAGSVVSDGGEEALVDPVGVDHDAAALGLAEDVIEPDRGDGFGGDHIPQYVSGPHGGQLIHVPDEDDGGARSHGFEKMVHQQDVYHGDLVHDHHVGRKRRIPVVFETAPGLEFEQPVDGFGLPARGFAHALGRASGGGAQRDGSAPARKQGDHAEHGGGLPRSGPAGEDQDVFVHRFGDGLFLAFGKGEPGAFFHRADFFAQIPKFHLRDLSKLMEFFRYGLFRIIERREIDMLVFENDLPLPPEIVQTRTEFLLRSVQNLGGPGN